MCEHKECEHSLSPSSHCPECDRLKLLYQNDPEWSDEVNGQTDDGLQTWINVGRFENKGII